jgi:hypothetical protein
MSGPLGSFGAFETVIMVNETLSGVAKPQIKRRPDFAASWASSVEFPLWPQDGLNVAAHLRRGAESDC